MTRYELAGFIRDAREVIADQQAEHQVIGMGARNARCATERRLGALHGLAANALPLIRGRHLLPRDRADAILTRIYDALRATALNEEGYTNWPGAVGLTNRPSSTAMLVQHCVGAPGIVTTTAGFPKNSRWPIDPLLERAGEFIWSVGPLIKMPVLCHGTPGNGYAFLKLYARSGEPRWLDRARGFAMHSIDQSERALKRYGQRKYSLWTGDLGLALYLWDCVQGGAQFPSLEVF